MGIRIGIVGLGSFGSEFAPLFKAHPLVDRVALCDLDPERIARFANDPRMQDKFDPADAYDSFDALCRADLDAVALFTQPWLHAPQAIQAMESGKHAYSAVPIICLPSGDEMLDWTDKLIAACRRTGMRYMMGETSYYHPEAMYCRKKAAEGAFGRFVFAEGEYFHDIDWPYCSIREVMKARRGKDWSMKYAGGIPMHYPTHSIGGLLSVMKTRMTKVSAHGYVHPNEDWFLPETEDANVMSNETALFHLENGACARICEYRRVACHGIAEQFSVYGTAASMVHSVDGPRWCTMTERRPLTVAEMRDPLPDDVKTAFQAVVKDPYGGHAGSHGPLVHEFVQSIVDDRQPAVNAWVAARFFVPGVMAHKSALQAGALLDVPDWGEAPAG